MKLILQEEWQKFTSRYSNDEICIEEICQLLNVDFFRCSNCESVNVERRAKARAIKCTKCKKTVWLTAGTLFHGIRLATVWFGALYLMAKGVQFNPNQFHEVAGIAYSTAWIIVKKLTLVIEFHFPEDYSVPSSEFSAVICRRSKETPAKKHPVSEEEADQEAAARNSEPQDDEVLAALGPQAKAVYDALSPDPIHFETLAGCTGFSAAGLASALTLLELSGLILALAGGRYRRSERKKQSQTVATEAGLQMVERAIEFIEVTFQGISRKYLQLHLAAHWCLVDRTRWSPQSLLKECLEFGRVTYAEIRAYVSPSIVKTAPAIHLLTGPRPAISRG